MLTVALATAMAVVSAGPGRGAGADVSTPDATFASLQDCLRSGAPLAALVLVDSSASLKRTDPKNRRVDAVTTVVRGLSALAGTANTRRVDVSLAAFGERVDVVTDWMTLDGAGTEAALNGAATFATRNKAIDTDYYDALLSARESMADHARAIGGSPCQMVLWITDGEYDISDRRNDRTPKSYATDIELGRPGSGARAVAVGFERLCAPDGVVDGLRSDGVRLVTVALSTQLADSAKERLLALSTGTSAGSSTCGRSETSTASPGTVLFADDADAVVVAVDRIAAQLAGAEPLPPNDAVPTCAAEPCADTATPFPLGPTLRGVHVLVRTGATDTSVVVRLPGGGRAVLRRGGPATLEAAGSSVRQQWLAPQIVAIDISTPAGAPEGASGSLVLLSSKPSTGAVQVYTVPIPEVPVTTTVPPATTTPPPTTVVPTTVAAAAAPVIPATTVAPKPTKSASNRTVPLLVAAAAAGVLLVGGAAFVLLRRRRADRIAHTLPELRGVTAVRVPVRVRYGLTPDVLQLDSSGQERPFRVTKASVSDPLPPVVDDALRFGSFVVRRDGARSIVRADGRLVASSSNRAGTLEEHGAQAVLPLALGGSWVFGSTGERSVSLAADLAGMDESRTVDLSHFRGLADPSLDGELVVFLSARADPGQVEQSVRLLLPALAQAIVAASS